MSFREGYRFGIVSTRRMDPIFWGKSSDAGLQLACTRQMLTKYIAVLYFHLAANHDPTSILHQPLIPNGGQDDIFESDVHPEQSATGLPGRGWACLSFHYSYATGKIAPTVPLVSDCFTQEEARSSQEGILQVQLNIGQFVSRSMEFELDSTPRIELRRGYRSDTLHNMALGVGTDYNYDAALTSDGIANLSLINIVRQDASTIILKRASPGRGFSPSIVFQNRDMDGDFLPARMTWESQQFKLQDSDGSWSTYLPCTAKESCLWNGYQDADKNLLRFDRDSHRTLRRLVAGCGFSPRASRRL